MNPLRDGPLVCLFFRLVVRSGDAGGLFDITVGLELHRVHRCAVEKREEGVRRANRALGWGEWVRDLIVLWSKSCFSLRLQNENGGEEQA